MKNNFSVTISKVNEESIVNKVTIRCTDGKIKIGAAAKVGGEWHDTTTGFFDALIDYKNPKTGEYVAELSDVEGFIAYAIGFADEVLAGLQGANKIKELYSKKFGGDCKEIRFEYSEPEFFDEF